MVFLTRQARAGLESVGPDFVPQEDPAAVVLDGTQPAEVLGGKGASLDRLVGYGIPVPPTGAVTTAAYFRLAAQPAIVALLDRLRSGEDVGADEVDAIFRAAELEPEDVEQVLRVAREVGGGRPVAVRSSATVEDLTQSSFAGQYRSVLDIDPDDRDQVLDAVRAVFASLWHPAPRAYRWAFGVDDASAGMAAVIMRMVPARRAGVVFTVDPAGDRSRARIEAVEGLGESLVSGAETPEASMVARDGDHAEIPPEVGDALDLALSIEQLEHRPQDVEWAWDGEQVWIVQARPITTGEDRQGDGFDDPLDDIRHADLTTAGIGEMLPGVLPPLRWAVDSHLVEEGFRQLLSELGVLPADVSESRALVHRVRGRAVMDFSRLQTMAAGLPGSASEQLESEYFGSRRRGRAAAPAGSVPRLRSVVHDLRVLEARQRSTRDAAVFERAVEEILGQRPDLPALEASDLLAYHLRLVDLATRGTGAELRVAAEAAATYRRLQIMLSRHVGAADAGRLAEAAVGRAGVATAVGPDASAAVIAGPTWRELGRTPPDPASRTATGDLDEDQLEAVLDEVRASPSWKPDSISARLRLRAMRRLAVDAAAKLGARERTKAALLALGGELRRIHLDCGRRLVALGSIAEPTDVELFTPAELRSALVDGAGPPADEIDRRRRWRTGYEQQGPLPQRFTGIPRTVEVSLEDTTRIEGWAASAGRYRGPVQVVESADDVLAEGAVLVAEATDPSWSPLFLRAGAIVLDRGGPLSHAAILAREIGVPAVLNVPGATRLLAGHEVTVDGDTGVVVVHEEAAS